MLVSGSKAYNYGASQSLQETSTFPSEFDIKVLCTMKTFKHIISSVFEIAVTILQKYNIYEILVLDDISHLI